MKKYALITIMALVGYFAKAQDDAKKLTIPSTPAFSILNYEPTSVMRPTSNKDLAADVLNSFDKKGNLLMNLGLEVSPYWLQSQPTLTREKYLNPDAGQTFLQSLSLSAATVKDSATGNNRFGGGFRFKLLNGHPVDSLAFLVKDLQKKSTILSDINSARARIGDPDREIRLNTRQQIIDVIIDAMRRNEYYDSLTILSFKNDMDKIAVQYSDSDADLFLFVQQLINTANDANSKLLKKVVTLTKQRKGFILEFAGASAFNMSQKNELERIGGWVNLSNYVSASDLFTFTARGMYQNRDTTTSNFDFGLSYLKKGDRYNVSVEAMARWYAMKIPLGQNIFWKKEDFTYRLAVQGSYLISKELSINLSFGKDFSNTSITGSGYFSILGFNYSIFNSEKVSMPSTN